MTKAYMRMTHGYNGGLTIKIKVVFLLFLMYSCSDDEYPCKYSFKSLATNKVQTLEYNVTKEVYEKSYAFLYGNLKDSTSHSYEIDPHKEEMRIFMNTNLDDIALLQSKKKYKLQEDTSIVECYRVSSDKLGEKLLVFSNTEYGILLLKSTGFVKELIRFKEHEDAPIELIELIKKDSIFYNYGGIAPRLPPCQNKPSL